ncbi:aminotransferase class IV [Gangjinia marincola]|uniref:branched-chain-amino-acid transaminase n=1 Tax=Gangjinia marincola TaxID=578463 RepID=A0ABP3XNK5_9FLAO
MVNINGELMSEESPQLYFNNRGLNYGDAVFETLRVINGEIIFWEDHYFRFMAAMRIMRMEIPMSFSPEFLAEEIQQIIRAKNLQQTPARVKLLAYRKSGGYYTPQDLSIEYLIRAEKLSQSFYTLSTNTYRVELFKDYYINKGLLSTIKNNNKAIHVLGSIFAKENDYANCLIVNDEKSVIEALNGNIFLVKDKVIKTPPISDGCLNGIIRKKLIEIISALDHYELVEESISPFELQKADELFITNVIMGIQPITIYRKKNFEKEVAKDLLGKLNAKVRLG